MRTLLNVLAVSAFALGGTVAAAPVPANAPDGTPIPTGTVWKGKLTQRGGGPGPFLVSRWVGSSPGRLTPAVRRRQRLFGRTAGVSRPGCSHSPDAV